METDYGRYFLANYQSGPLPASCRFFEAASATSRPAADDAEAKIMPIARQSPSTEACQTTSTGTPGSTSGGVFRLAPPPPPVNQFSVGSPAEAVVKIETLKELIATDRKSLAADAVDDTQNPTGALHVDDEESLLGDVAKAADTAKADMKSTPLARAASSNSGALGRGDGVDSDSADDDDDDAGKSLRARAVVDEVIGPGKEDKVVEMPPPQPLGTSVEQTREIAENITTENEQELQAKVKPIAAELPVIKAISVEEEHSKETEIGNKLDRFFDDVQNWMLVVKEVGKTSKASQSQSSTGQHQMFRVRVPKPYPGVQLRKSMNLDDKHPRFLEDGKIVSGTLDESGAWLILGSDNFLPTVVGTLRILEPVASQSDGSHAGKAGTPKKVTEESDAAGKASPSWWSCCSGASAASGSTEVFVSPTENAAGRGNSHDSGVAGSSKVPNASGQSSLGLPGSPPASNSSDAAFRQAKDYSTGVTQLPRHISNPIDPFSDSPDAPLGRRPTPVKQSK